MQHITQGGTEGLNVKLMKKANLQTLYQISSVIIHG